MAELAGLVLGALPLIIWALEKYSEPLEEFHRYRVNIESFRSQIIIQKFQLERTLENIGLRNDISKQELQECFEIKFPQISRELIFIVRQMDDVILELAKSLDVDINANQDSYKDKFQWNWTRVKRSFSTKKRDKILETLRHLNGDLRNIVEKAELPEESDSSKLRELKIRFNTRQCASIRKCLSSLHRALGAGLCCACSSPHQAAVDLDWETYDSSNPARAYKVAVTYKKIAELSQSVDSWKKLHIAAHITPQLAGPELKIPEPPPTSPRTPSPMTSIRSKIVRFASFTSLETPSRLPTRPAPVVTAATTTAVTVASTSSCADTGLGEELHSLCDAMCDSGDKPQIPSGYFKDPSKDPENDDHQRFFFLPANKPNLYKITEAIQLKSFLSLPSSGGDGVAAGKQKSRGIHTLSAKQRYGIAAALAWSVLHLGETPWLADDWSERQASIFIEQDKRSTWVPDKPRPYLSYDFATNKGKSTGTTSPHSPQSGFDELVPHPVICTLGVLLVKLCCHTTHSSSGGSGSLTDDYRVARDRLDEVRRTAGDAYGDAAERCLKFSFSGVSEYRRFDLPKFMTQFYNEVVAPVQAAYYLMPG